MKTKTDSPSCSFQETLNKKIPTSIPFLYKKMDWKQFQIQKNSGKENSICHKMEIRYCKDFTKKQFIYKNNKPFLNATNTLRAPQRRADVAQSNAVSPAPKTTTLPWSCGRADLHEHIPRIIKLFS